MAVNEAIILAGGKGTRLASMLPSIPKSMAPVNGKPFLSYVLDYLEKQQISKVIISVGYLKEYIIKNIGDSYRKIKIQYSAEDSPLGTGGAIKAALANCKQNEVFVLNGDTYFQPDLNEMQLIHNQIKADISIAVKWLEDTSRYGSINYDNEGRITSFTEKSSCLSSGYINGGIYLINKKIIEDFEENVFSIENDFFKKEMQNYHINACFSKADFLDIGIPSDYIRAADLLKNNGL